MNECPACGAEMQGVEYFGGYDGVSEWACVDAAGCGVRIGRWTGKHLKLGEYEAPFGGEE